METKTTKKINKCNHKYICITKYETEFNNVNGVFVCEKCLNKKVLRLY